MQSVLILHRSKHGHTAKIADRIAQVIRADHVEVTVHPIDVAGVLALETYDAIVIGSSIHAGRHDHVTLDWIRRHAHSLNAMPSAAYSVSLTAAEDTEEARGHVERFLHDLLEETGWTPTLKTSFAGALQYLEYDRFTRLLVRLLMKKGGHPTDTSRDYDYTNWDAVEAFAHEIAALAAKPAGVG